MQRSLPTFSNSFKVAFECIPVLNLELIASLQILALLFVAQRVRHSEMATERVYTEIEEMTCTMRVWHKTSGRPPSESLSRSAEMVAHGTPPLFEQRRSLMVLASREFHPPPELILTSVCGKLAEQPHMCCSADFGDDPIPLSDRFVSFGSLDPSTSNWSTAPSLPRSPRNSNSSHKLASSNGNNRRRIGTVTIPVKDIVMMDVNGGSKDASTMNRLNITTLSSGFFEVTMDSSNGREILLAFLKGSMPKERLMAGGELTRNGSNSTHNTTYSFDVEAFTASRMSERLKSESMSEKVQRRIHRLVSSLDESEF